MAKPRTKQKTRVARATTCGDNPTAFYVCGLYGRGAPLLIAEAILFAAASVFMFLRPLTALTFITYMLGAGLILCGLWRTIAGFTGTNNTAGGILDVLFGLMNVILGVLFCVFPTGSVVALSYVFIILFFFKAMRALVFAVNMARARFGHYVFTLVLAVMLILLAAVLFFFPLVTAVAIIYYLAVAMGLYAISDVYMFVEWTRLKRAVK